MVTELKHFNITGDKVYKKLEKTAEVLLQAIALYLGLEEHYFCVLHTYVAADDHLSLYHVGSRIFTYTIYLCSYSISRSSLSLP